MVDDQHPRVHWMTIDKTGSLVLPQQQHRLLSSHAGRHNPVTALAERKHVANLGEQYKLQAYLRNHCGDP